jgi:hypothetical protein
VDHSASDTEPRRSDASEERCSDVSDARHATVSTDEVSRPTSAAPVLLRVAFATTRHAEDALTTLAKCPDLIASADLHRCPATHDEMGLVDIFVGPANRPRVESLAVLLRGIVVH